MAPVVEVTRVAPGPAVPSLDDFFFPDPPLDGLTPPLEWAFRQESWSGGNEWQQHCQELGYPARLREQVLREANAIIAARGIDGQLPDTIRRPPIVLAFGDVTTVVETPEPLVKLVVCTEGVAPRLGRDRLVATLRTYARAPDFALGEPDSVWRRSHRGGAEELGFGWTTSTREAIVKALTSSGYVEETEPGGGTIWKLPGQPVRARVRMSSLSWMAVR